MFKKLLPWYLVSLVVLSLAFIYGCGSAPTSGGGGGGAIANRTGVFSYTGTQATGDVWSWTISTSEFSGTNETTNMWVTGTWITLASGFGKATVSTSSGGPGAPSAGDQAYFLEFPNTLLAVKPMSGESGSDVIVCAAAATMEPDAPASYSVIYIPWSGWDVANDQAYATVEAVKNGTTGSFEFTVTDFYMGGTVKGVPDTKTGFTFEAGRLTSSGSPGLQIFMTPSNVFIGDSGPGQGGMAGAKVPITAILSTEMSGKEFRGILFKYFINGDHPSETEPIGAAGQPDGRIFAGSFLNNDYLSPNYGKFLDTYSKTVTLEFTGTTGGITTGILRGTDGATSESIFNLIISKVGADDKMMIMGIATGEYTYDVTPIKRVDNFMLIEK